LLEATSQAPTAARQFHLAQAYLKCGDRRAATEMWRKAIASGLTVAALHPLERNAYEQMRAQLEER
jgi:hypothetical protein